MVGNTAANSGQSWCSAVICKKRSAFEMQSHLIVDSILLKTCEKDHGDSSSLLLEGKDLISMYRGALVRGFVHILVYFNKRANYF